MNSPCMGLGRDDESLISSWSMRHPHLAHGWHLPVLVELAPRGSSEVWGKIQEQFHIATQVTQIRKFFVQFPGTANTVIESANKVNAIFGETLCELELLRDPGR